MNNKRNKPNKPAGCALRQIPLTAVKKPLQARVREILDTVRPGHCITKDDFARQIREEGYGMDSNHIHIVLSRCDHKVVKIMGQDGRMTRVIVRKEVA